GVFADHRILFSSYVSPSWDMLVILRFGRYVDLARWRAIERKDPGGLGPEALQLGAPVSTQVADAMWEDTAPDRDPSTAVYLVIPYEYPDRARYKNYVDVYVLPQMKGWLKERATSGYTVFLNHNDAGPAWDSLLVLEYRDLAALGRRRVVVDKVRGELRNDPGWRTVSDVKGEFREEGEVVQAEPILPR
ncbi:MAG TPA: hypothetical protein VFM29_02465, partial [Vicinamibacteria bacterium]|nr:hypothetical protein [Vicinamibacteria bacterium]